MARADRASEAVRSAGTRQRGATVWFTGLPSSGKSTLAGEVERELVESGRAAYVLDGDTLRRGLSSDLGFSRDDRHEHARRVAEVACLFADAGFVSLVSLVSPFQASRSLVRALHDNAGLTYVEVYLATTLEECERRDSKGLYRRARAGTVLGVTGIDDPYEVPVEPDLTITPDDGDPALLAARVIELLGDHEQASR